MPTADHRAIAEYAAEEWAHFHGIFRYTTDQFVAVFRPRYQRESMLNLLRLQLGTDHPAHQSYRAAYLAEGKQRSLEASGRQPRARYGAAA